MFHIKCSSHLLIGTSGVSDARRSYCSEGSDPALGRGDSRDKHDGTRNKSGTSGLHPRIHHQIVHLPPGQGPHHNYPDLNKTMLSQDHQERLQRPTDLDQYCHPPHFQQHVLSTQLTQEHNRPQQRQTSMWPTIFMLELSLGLTGTEAEIGWPVTST